jgi:DNA-binding transcriptional MerR regulator
MVDLLIGDVAQRTGLSAPTIRYYESLGLLTRPARSPTGYRRYTQSNLEELRFIKKAQALGFSLEETGEILRLTREGAAPCSHVLDLARRHLAAVEERIQQLRRFRGQLAGEISKWEEQRQPSCSGLCKIIADSSITGTNGESTRSRLRKGQGEDRRR